MIKLLGYKIIKKIGSGGMGDVYLAEHEKLERKVAIKSLHKNLVTDTSFRERFSQEAKTHSKLDHPNIVKLLDYKERKDGLFLIMEYVDGKQLDEHIKKVTGPIPEKELTALFTQILDAIGYAHEEGLVHRDIKPSNIMIDKKGKIKVLDFGIAKMQEEEKGLTKTGIQIGTAAYMSPEQVDAKRVDKLSDIYSLGVTLFYMAVGKSPYSDDTNSFRIQEKIMREPFPTASDVYPGVSKKLETIILKSTQKDKKDRYKSCEEFKKDLELPLEKISKIETAKSEKKGKKKEIVLGSILLFLFSLGCVYFLVNPAENATEETIEEVVVEEATEEIMEDVLCSKSTFKIGDYLGGGIVYYIYNNGENALVCDIKDLGKAKFGCFGISTNSNTGIAGSTLCTDGKAIGRGQANTKDLCKIKLNRQFPDGGVYADRQDPGNEHLAGKPVIRKVHGEPEAALLCANSLSNGYDDWFLPSIDELYAMYLNKLIIDSSSLSNGGSVFLKKFYWSSTLAKLGSFGTWKQDFDAVIIPSHVDEDHDYLEYYSKGQRSGYRDQINNVRAVRMLSNDCEKACCLGCRATEGEAICLSDHSCCAAAEKLDDIDSRKIPLPTALEIYRKRFNKEPDYGEYIDVSSSYFTGEILYSRITEVLDAWTHKRYGKLNEGLAYADRDIEMEPSMVVLGHRSEIKYLLGDYIGALNDINKAIVIAKTGEDADYWIAMYVEERELINNMLENK